MEVALKRVLTKGFVLLCGLLFLSFVTLLPFAAAHGQMRPSQPVVLDLRALGVVLPNVDFRGAQTLAKVTELFNHNTASIEFIDEDRIAFYYGRTSAPGSAKANGSKAPRLLRAYLLSTGSRQLLWEREWPAENRRWFSNNYDTESTLLALAGGKFLVQAADTLQVYSPALEVVRQKRFNSLGGNTSGAWAVFVAAEGKLLYLHHTLVDDTLDQWLRADTLEPIASVAAPVLTVLDVANRSLLLRGDHCLRIEEGGLAVSDLACGRVTDGLFLSNSSVMISRGNDLSIVSLTGATIWSGGTNTNGHSVVVQVFRSLSGQVFGALLSAEKGQTWNGAKIKSKPVIVAYNRQGQLLLVTNNGPKYYQAFALSPQGTKLAIFDGESLYVYRIAS